MSKSAIDLMVEYLDSSASIGASRSENIRIAKRLQAEEKSKPAPVEAKGTYHDVEDFFNDEPIKEGIINVDINNGELVKANNVGRSLTNDEAKGVHEFVMSHMKATAEGSLVEELAELEHIQWANIRAATMKRGEKTQYNSLVIPADRVESWERQIATKYQDLTEDEKELDRIEARKVLAILSRYRPASPAVEELVRELREVCNKHYEPWGEEIKPSIIEKIIAKYDNAKGGK